MSNMLGEPGEDPSSSRHIAPDPYAVELARAWYERAELVPHDFVQRELQAYQMFSRIATLSGVVAVDMPVMLDHATPQRKYSHKYNPVEDGGRSTVSELFRQAYVPFDGDGQVRGVNTLLAVYDAEEYDNNGGSERLQPKTVFKRNELPWIDRLVRPAYLPTELDWPLGREARDFEDGLYGRNEKAKVRFGERCEAQEAYLKHLGRLQMCLGIGDMPMDMQSIKRTPFISRVCNRWSPSDIGEAQRRNRLN